MAIGNNKEHDEGIEREQPLVSHLPLGLFSFLLFRIREYVDYDLCACAKDGRYLIALAACTCLINLTMLLN